MKAREASWGSTEGDVMSCVGVHIKAKHATLLLAACSDVELPAAVQGGRTTGAQLSTVGCSRSANGSLYPC